MLGGCFFTEPGDIAFAPDDDDTVDEDRDGDGFLVDEGDCDDQDASRYPGAPEILDLQINDCESLEVREEWVADINTPRVVGSVSQHALGSSISIGDLNGDGLGDLCVRGELQDLSTNAPVYVFLSASQSAQNLGALTIANADAVIGGLRGEGKVECSEDVDGDGADDLLVASAHVDAGNSGLYVFMLGSEWGAAGTLSPDDASASLEGSRDESVGHCFSVGNVIGDSAVEILVGKNTSPIGVDIEHDRVVEVWDAGLNTVHRTIESDASHWNKGLCEVVGDLSGGGLEDVIVGSPRSTTLYLGERMEALPDTFGPAAEMDEWSSGAGGGDFDGDGIADFYMHAVSWSNEASVDVGVAMIFWGVEGTASWEVPFFVNDQPVEGRGIVLAGELEGGLFGGNVTALGDLNGDGIAEIAVTEDGHDLLDYPGRVLVYAGRSRQDWEQWGPTVLPVRADATFAGFAGNQGEAAAPHLGDGQLGWDLSWQPPTGPGPGLWAPSLLGTFNTGENAGVALHWATGSAP